MMDVKVQLMLLTKRGWKLLGVAFLAFVVVPVGSYKYLHARASRGPTDVLVPISTTIAQKIVEGAKVQLVNPARYDATYRHIPYPNGDVKPDRGACTDVVIRALRNAGYDLQKLVHEDILSSRGAYPHITGDPDTNIDHRRVPNLQTFFSRRGQSLSLATDGKARETWQPGDFVCWKLLWGKDHIGVLSDRMGKSGLPMVIHNMSETAEEDVLTGWKIVGHYRYPAPRKQRAGSR